MDKKVNDNEKSMLEAQEKLAEIINNTPHLVSLNKTEYKITRLKNGTQCLICEEACKVVKGENQSFGDVMKMFAVNMPSICKVLAFAVLNDKKRIYKDGNEINGLSDEFNSLYDTFMWDVEDNALANLLYEVFSMLDINFFLSSSEIVKTMRWTMTKRTQPQK